MGALRCCRRWRQAPAVDRASDRDRVGRDHDLIDEPTRITLAHVAVVGAKLREDHLSQSIDRIGRDSLAGRRELALDQQDFLFEVCPAGALVSETYGEIRVAPVFHDEGIRPHSAAFDTVTGKPTDQLLMLLMLAGQYPRQIDIATDGKLIALRGKPTMLAPR